MKKTPTFIAAFLAVATTGCVMPGATKKPVPPAPVVAKPAPAPAPPPLPPPLSTPQTQVDLPKPQFLDPAALAPDAPPQPQVEPAEPPPSSRPAGGRRPTGAGTQSAPPTAPAGTPPSATPPATSPSPEPATPQTPIQEIVPVAEAKRLQELAQAKRRDVQQMLDQLARRQQLSTAQKGTITLINSSLASSVDAERRGDMKLADALASNAQILAKDLLNGK
ncbi:MAG TPA: hypothetical protein VNV86_09555 [Candidatus Acidoferrum sp.]|nr:hypothetical protein [Candidatus Acidoferrum sp.]